MSLVRWFRKNNKKVMAVVVIVIMFGFVGGSALQRFLQRGRGELHKPVAYFGNNKKITNYDLSSARRELEILQALAANDMLRGIFLPEFRSQDLRAVLLGELLFSDRRTSPVLIYRIKQTIRTNGYSISDKQINGIYRRLMPGNIYWLLLKNEAQLAGVRIPNEDAGVLLGRIIPQLTGETYSQRIGALINRRGIPEDQILTTFGKLLAVLAYAKMVCSSEDVTNSQIMYNVSLEEERIDVEFVKFDSSIFAESQDRPTQQEIVEHFGKYKKFFAGSVSEENPYGFGYKLPESVGLEYIALKLDDVSAIVTPPTQEEAEEFYQKHREQFIEQIRTEPNDPNSPLTERTKSYAEVANEISNYLLQNKINSKAERILQEARALTEAGFEDIDIEAANLSSEQFRKAAGDYKDAADQLSEKYEIKVYAGQTGLLSAADIDMRRDEYLGKLHLKGTGYNPVLGYNPVWLTQIVFAIEELQTSELGPFDVAAPRMYENIGPMKDMLGQITAVLRAVKAEKASEPESINQTYSKDMLKFETTSKPRSENIYSVKDKVVEDLKKLAAMDTAKSKAEEFIKQVAKDGWVDAIDKFNKLYGRQAKQDERDPNVFELQNFTNLPRISSMALKTLAVQNSGNPAARFFVNERKNNGRLISQLYSLVPQDANSLETVPLIMEFKPDMSYYCLKEIGVKRLEREEYEKIKAMRFYKEDTVQSQSLAPVHFNPENILKRMNFRLVTEDEEETDANTPAEVEGVS